MTYINRGLINHSGVKKYIRSREKQITPEAMELVEHKFMQLLDRIIRESMETKKIKAVHINMFRIHSDL